jgi:hypothetical protein
MAKSTAISSLLKSEKPVTFITGFLGRKIYENSCAKARDFW